MQFTKLRLAGFKSFVDPTELEISPGLTGVVGPNGCGKSNLVEALKWVMGETSAKQMRGSEMDDVIFSGTADRPSRNIAEVALYMDNTDRGAPSIFNDNDDLEVSRRIERDKGSTYKVNAREVRAKDVHLLFADAASGARSTALVSQGRVGAVVSAKPADRRKLLEEAAGITGLHSRRHEAELRLRGAETNLERLDDIMVTLETQMAGLKKQVRQATRYKNLSGHIRKAEATLFHIRWTDIEAELATAREQLNQAETAVASMTSGAGRASTEQAEIAAKLPELRNNEAEAAAKLQRLTIARESLEQEEQRLADQQSSLESRLEQTGRDSERERTLAADAENAITRLGEENGRLTAGGGGEDGALEEAAGKLAEARKTYEAGEAGLAEQTNRLAHDEARKADLERRMGDAEARITRLKDGRENLTREIARLEATAGDREALARADRETAEAAEALTRARAAAQTAEATRLEAQNRLSAAQETAQTTATAEARLKAEEEALAEILETGDPDLWPPMIDSVSVEQGLEAALGIALGEDLGAAMDEAAPVHWRRLPAFSDAPSLPAGAQPLGEFVRGPEALLRRLSQIGVVNSTEDGWRLLPELKQGQRLVGRDGAFWRWDGYTAAADAPSAAAIRLEQRNRLGEIRVSLQAAGMAARQSAELLETARNGLKAASDGEASSRESVREAETEVETLRQAQTALRRKFAESDSRLDAQREAVERLDQDLRDTERQLTEARDALGGIADLDAVRAGIDELREEVSRRRAAFVESQAAYDSLKNRAEERRRRLEEIASEIESWTDRKTGAEERIAQLAERRAELETALEALKNRPGEIGEQRNALLDRVGEAETGRKAAADELARMETKLAEADRALREAERELAGMREGMVRAEAAVEQAKQAASALTERIRDRLDAGPGALFELAGLKEDQELPEPDAAEKKVERLLRERDNMGPVNLRAEVEARELEEQMSSMLTERDDLLKAIDRLRRGINELNREGRQRLLASYEEVDKHFQELFTRLFAGGRAHLTLVDSDDPLEAGIEIMASPPGKRLQVLSLLSGGEQALTALALLFAVFLTNPAPICVLDEVDAPLDDNNVDRFCSLVEEIAHSLSTRFLVITHHRMTMARVDRLFGVTMGEQGVSQLVSVDLGQAMALRQTA